MQKFAFLSILLISVGVHAAPLIEIESTTMGNGVTETECPDDDTTPMPKPISQDDLSKVKEAISNYQAVTESSPPKDKEELNRLFKQFEESLAKKVGSQSQAQSQSQAADGAGAGEGQTQAQSQSQGQGMGQGQTQAQSQSQGQGMGAGQTQAQSQSQDAMALGMDHHPGKHNHKHKHQHKHEMN